MREDNTRFGLPAVYYFFMPVKRVLYFIWKLMEVNTDTCFNTRETLTLKDILTLMFVDQLAKVLKWYPHERAEVTPLIRDLQVLRWSGSCLLCQPSTWGICCHMSLGLWSYGVFTIRLLYHPALWLYPGHEVPRFWGSLLVKDVQDASFSFHGESKLPLVLSALKQWWGTEIHTSCARTSPGLLETESQELRPGITAVLWRFKWLFCCGLLSPHLRHFVILQDSLLTHL